MALAPKQSQRKKAARLWRGTADRWRLRHEAAHRQLRTAECIKTETLPNINTPISRANPTGIRLRALQHGAAANIEQLAVALGTPIRSLRDLRRSYVPLEDAVQSWLRGRRNSWEFWELFVMCEDARRYRKGLVRRTRSTTDGRFTTAL